MPAVLPAKRDDGLPVLLDKERDITIPRQLFAPWVPNKGPRAIVRALSAEERSKIKARFTTLEEALKPFIGNDESTVRASISGLFSGYRSMRQQDENAEAVVNVTMAVLREFPAWAIAQACRKIVCGETKLDRRFAPNDTEIFDIVAGVVRPYRENLRQAKALLDAPVDEPPPRGPSGGLVPMRPRPALCRASVYRLRSSGSWTRGKNFSNCLVTTSSPPPYRREPRVERHFGPSERRHSSHRSSR